MEEVYSACGEDILPMEEVYCLGREILPVEEMYSCGREILPVGEMYPCGRSLFPGKNEKWNFRKNENCRFEKLNV